MTWAAKQVAINKTNKQNAQAQGISVKEYLLKCGVDESTSSFQCYKLHGWCPFGMNTSSCVFGMGPLQATPHED